MDAGGPALTWGLGGSEEGGVEGRVEEVRVEEG